MIFEFIQLFISVSDIYVIINHEQYESILNKHFDALNKSTKMRFLVNDILSSLIRFECETNKSLLKNWKNETFLSYIADNLDEQGHTEQEIAIIDIIIFLNSDGIIGLEYFLEHKIMDKFFHKMLSHPFNSILVQRCCFLVEHSIRFINDERYKELL